MFHHGFFLLLVLLHASHVSTHAITGTPSDTIISHVTGNVRSVTDKVEAYNLMNHIEKELLEKNKADKEATQLTALEQELRDAMAGTSTGGATGGATGATGGQDGATGAVIGSTGFSTGATGSGSTGGVIGSTGSSTGATGSASTGGSMSANDSTGSTASLDATSEETMLLRAADELLSTSVPKAKTASPMNLTEKVWKRADEIIDQEDQSLAALEKGMVVSVQHCTDQTESLHEQVHEAERQLSTSAHHLLQLNKLTREPMLVLRDAFPILEQYANVLSSAKTSSKLEEIHLNQQENSIQHLLAVCDQMYKVVGVSVPASLSKVRKIKNIKDTRQKKKKEEVTKTSQLEIVEIRGRPASSSLLPSQHSTSSSTDGLSLDVLAAQRDALSNMLEDARTSLVSMLTDDMYRVRTTTRSERHKARSQVSALTLQVEKISRKLHSTVRRKEMASKLEEVESEMIENKNMVKDIKLIRARVQESMKTVDGARASLRKRLVEVNEAVEMYVSPIRTLLGRIPNIVKEEERKFLQARKGHVSLRKRANMLERGVAELAQRCVVEFRKNVGVHASLVQRESLARKTRTIMWSRISKAESLWEHVKFLSELGTKRSEGVAHAQLLVRDSMEAAKTKIENNYGTNAEAPIYLSKMGRSEREITKGSADTREKTEWVVGAQGGGVTLSRAMAGVQAMSAAVRVVELSIEEHGKIIENATRYVRKSARIGMAMTMKLNVSRTHYLQRRDVYVEVNQRYHVLEKKLKFIMKPWNAQVVIDVNVTEKKLQVAVALEKKAREEVERVKKNLTAWTKKYDDATATVESAKVLVGEASTAVDEVKVQLDKQWATSQALPSLLLEADEDKIDRVKGHPSKEDEVALEDGLIMGNGKKLEELSRQLHMENQDVVENHPATTSGSSWTASNQHRFQRVQAAASAGITTSSTTSSSTQAVAPKKEIVDEIDLDEARKNLDAKQSKVEKFEIVQNDADKIVEVLQAELLLLEDALSNVTNKTEHLELLLQADHRRHISTKAKVYQRLYDRFVETSGWLNLTMERNGAKRSAEEARNEFVGVRIELSSTIRMMDSAKAGYTASLSDLLAARKELNELKIKLYRREATVRFFFSFLCVFLEGLFGFSFFFFRRSLGAVCGFGVDCLPPPPPPPFFLSISTDVIHASHCWSSMHTSISRFRSSTVLLHLLQHY